MDASIASAVIGAVAVGGTALGTVLGGWVQARGGRAQAEAARQAARIAAEATHHQALYDRRWSLLAAYLRAASECVEAADQLYSTDSLPDVRRRWHAFTLAHAEAELMAPPGLLAPIDDLRKAVGRMYWTAQQSAPAERALKELRRRVEQGETAALRAYEAVERLWESDEHLPLPPEQRASSPDYALAGQALDGLPGFGSEQAAMLLNRTRQQREAASSERETRKSNHIEARRELVAAARTVFGTDRL
ncbi:hypothetical protein ABZ135_35280 [Streptomyces sp. NPDC006339]|uniref:hypothetical protein n=1 Tax=Streptomyces sp. NPDC006339 TaxID=3156755 RepID=UPI0033ACAA42